MSDLTWFKSSYSSGSSGDCIEVALEWRKSSFSGSSGDNCIEVAECPGTVHVRDSKDPEGPQLAFPAGEWERFVAFARG